MKLEKASFSFRSNVFDISLVVILIALVGLPIYACASLVYSETKGPFKNWMQVVDWEGDGDLDVIVSHTRWEAADISWAGIGIWVNQGDGTFELLRDRGTGTHPFGGFAAGAGDVDQDGDLDVFTQDFSIRLLVNQGGAQEGESDQYLTSSGINLPSAYNQGYRDMGGTISIGDLNGDGRIDAFIAGCCYGINATRPQDDYPHAPSVSWVWINEGSAESKYTPTGHNIPMDFLDGRPIRQVALGDLDGDSDLDVFAAVGNPTMGMVDSIDDLILLNGGTGMLTAFDQQLGNSDSTSVTLGDVNGDGRLDSLVGMNTGASLWLNQYAQMENVGPIFVQAEQSFKAVQTIQDKLKAWISITAEKLLDLHLPYGSIRTKAVFLNDLDGDGDLDALLARVWGAEIWWNDGHGKFHQADVHFGYREDTGVAVADFDGDGDQDIFIGRNEDNYQVWWNDGDGNFIQ
jgi:hypothetical protein